MSMPMDEVIKLGSFFSLCLTHLFEDQEPELFNT